MTYAIDGQLTLSSVQDQSRSESSGFGLSINNGSISGNYHSSETTRSAVNQQSGILAHSGSSGYINDLTLNGAYLVDKAGLAGNNSNLTLLGNFISTDINNHASIDSTSISASFTTTPTPKDPASTQKTEAASHLNLPSKQSNATNSTTHSVVAGITFINGNGEVVDTGNVRATLDGANQTLKDPAKQDLDALQVFMGTLAAVEATNQVGNLAMFKDHEDGSAAKVTLHAINGGLTHLLTGGQSADIGGAIAGAAATEALMAYAKTGNAQTDQLMASLIGGTASALSGGNFDDGAVSGGFADAFNRQLHEKEIAWIKANAKNFAAEHKLTEKQATAILAQQALRIIDAKWDKALGDDDTYGAAAAEYLKASGGGLFTATEAERNDFYKGYEVIVKPDQNKTMEFNEFGITREADNPLANLEFYQEFVSPGVVNRTTASLGSGLDGTKDFFVNTKDGLISLYAAVKGGQIGLHEVFEMTGAAGYAGFGFEMSDKRTMALLAGDEAEADRVTAEYLTGAAIASGVGAGLKSVGRTKVPTGNGDGAAGNALGNIPVSGAGKVDIPVGYTLASDGSVIGKSAEFPELTAKYEPTGYVDAHGNSILRDGATDGYYTFVDGRRVEMDSPYRDAPSMIATRDVDGKPLYGDSTYYTQYSGVRDPYRNDLAGGYDTYDFRGDQPLSVFSNPVDVNRAGAAANYASSMADDFRMAYLGANMEMMEYSSLITNGRYVMTIDEVLLSGATVAVTYLGPAAPPNNIPEIIGTTPWALNDFYPAIKDQFIK